MFRELALPGVRMSARGILAIILKKIVDGKSLASVKKSLGRQVQIRVCERLAKLKIIHVMSQMSQQLVKFALIFKTKIMLIPFKISVKHKSF